MHHLLLVSYHFPPEPVAGACRPGFLARYLPEFGWRVTTLTRTIDAAEPSDPEQGRCTIRTPVLGESFERSVRGKLDGTAAGDAADVPALRLALRWAKEALLFPDRTAGWLYPAIVRGLRLSCEQRFDAILSTAAPATAHVIGAAIARRRRLPWLADYRDPWSGNRYVQRSWIRQAAERNLERALIRCAAGITTISKPIAAQLERLHGRPVAVIPNAYDPADWPGPLIRPERFELCFTGSMYDGQRSPALLFEALAALRDEHDPAARTRMLFYGPNSDGVRALAHQYGLEDAVEQHGVVPRSQALQAQRSASTLLVFLNTDAATADELGSKIFEYAAARRPVIALGPPASAMRTYLGRHRLGWFASDLAETKAALREAYRRFAAGERELPLDTGAIPHARDLARAFAVQLGDLV